jgi:hypothetical protein
MTREQFDALLMELHEPFRAFAVELTTGTRIEIDYPLAFRDGAAVFLSATRVPYWFNHTQVSRFVVPN